MSTPITIANVHTLLFDALRTIDEEATNWTYWKGTWQPTGLVYYALHVSPNTCSTRTRLRCLNELPWCHRIGRLLESGDHGLRVSSNQRDKLLRYRGSGEKGDLLITFAGGDRLFLELKPAYKAYLENERPTVNGWYRPYLTSLDRSSAASDLFHKLPRIDRTIAEYIGFLLVGFDIIERPEYKLSDADITELLTVANVQCPPWTQQCAEWYDVHHTQYAVTLGLQTTCRVQCRLWWRQVAAAT